MCADAVPPGPGSSRATSGPVPQALNKLSQAASEAQAEGKSAANSAALFRIADLVRSSLTTIQPAALAGAGAQIHLMQRAEQGNATIRDARKPTWDAIDREARGLRNKHQDWSKSEVAEHILKTLKPTYSRGKPYTAKHIVRRICKLWPEEPHERMS